MLLGLTRVRLSSAVMQRGSRVTLIPPGGASARLSVGSRVNLAQSGGRMHSGIQLGEQVMFSSQASVYSTHSSWRAVISRLLGRRTRLAGRYGSSIVLAAGVAYAWSEHGPDTLSYLDGGSGGSAPSSKPGVLTKLGFQSSDGSIKIPAWAVIMGINAGVFALWKFLPESFMLRNFTVSTAHLMVTRHNPTRLYHVLFTNMFSHSEGWHFFLNMFAFFSFAPNTNSVLGNFDFTMAYLTAGLTASAAAFAANQVKYRLSGNTTFLTRPSLGASGSLLGILGIYACLFPNARFSIIFFPFGSFSADSMIKGLAVFDSAGLVYSFFRTSIFDHGAHLGGLGGGLLLYYGYLQKQPRVQTYQRLRAQGYVR